MCWKPYSLETAGNAFDAYCGPLSDTRYSGIPSLANTDFRSRIISADVIEFNFASSTYLE